MSMGKTSFGKCPAHSAPVPPPQLFYAGPPKRELPASQQVTSPYESLQRCAFCRVGGIILGAHASLLRISLLVVPSFTLFSEDLMVLFAHRWTRYPSRVQSLFSWTLRPLSLPLFADIRVFARSGRKHGRNWFDRREPPHQPAVMERSRIWKRTLITGQELCLRLFFYVYTLPTSSPFFGTSRI